MTFSKKLRDPVIKPSTRRMIQEARDPVPMAFAALWETWKGEGETLESCCLVTTEANDVMAEIHNRMPVILDPQDLGRHSQVLSRLSHCICW